jgi:Leucine-rich repeat (LRR) protein
MHLRYFSTCRNHILLLWALIWILIFTVTSPSFTQSILSDFQKRTFYKPPACKEAIDFLRSARKDTFSCLVVHDSLWIQAKNFLPLATNLHSLYHLDPSGEKLHYQLPDSLAMLVVWSKSALPGNIRIEGKGLQELVLNGPLSNLKKVSAAKGNPIKKIVLSGLGNDIQKVKIKGDSLKIVSVDRCKLSSFKKIKCTKGLHKLQISNSKIERVDLKSLKRYRHIQELVLSNDSIGDDKIILQRLKRLKTLVLSGNLLTKLPSGLISLDSLETLTLAYNSFQQLPLDTRFPPNLKSISFYKNDLIEIPACLENLYSLHTLDLYYNKIKSLPDFLSRMDSLNTLYLSHNQIHVLPPTLARMKQLTKLYLHHNKLTSVPDTIIQLKSLEVLHLNHNYLTTFPEVVLGLNHLTDLDLSNNMIERFPLEIKSLQSLQLLAIQNNAVTEKELKEGETGTLIDELKRAGVRVIY